MIRPTPGLWATLPIAFALAHASAQAQEPLEVDGFAWAENLTFDGNGSLFVSDSVRGEIWRIQPQGDVYTSTLFLSDFDSVGGLASSEDGRVIYAATTTDSIHHLVAFFPHIPGGYTVVAEVPKKPNGLVLVGDTLFATTEGGFIPGGGEVYAVDTTTGAQWTPITGLWAADGAAVDPDEEILYVGEVVSGKVYAYDLRFDELAEPFQGLNGLRLSWLDDFTFGDDPDLIYGTDFARGTVVLIPVGVDLRGPPDVLARGFAAPTAVAFGRGPGFHETSLYVTEGGGLNASVTDRRVVEIPNVR